ncbi:MAG: PEP-CTERM sorting domain-containing protein [Nostoc sp.]|uniref:PEP-CTERM sorting domain-containing protein n=1 Tax=Nostoc sp. TaxID=1180 RepID=UPI002FFA859C
MRKNNRKKAVTQAISTAVALGWLIMQVESAKAATLVVNNLNDSGVGSLRDIISIANSNDVVEFLLESHFSTITLTSGTLAIPAAGYAYAKDLTINGPGANLLTISSNNQFPVFDISAANVKLSGLAIAGDFNAYDSGNLTFINSTVSGDNVNIDSNLRLINSTISADNVKIDNATDNLSLINSTISSNNNIEINASDVRLSDHSHLVSNNNIEINASDVMLSDHSHLFSSNNIEINASLLSIQDNSNIATSNAISNSGTLSISTANLGLNNEGQINAGSNNSQPGGTLSISIPELLLRRVPQPSAIAAGSNNSGAAGNITINSPFIVAPPNEPSTIAAGSNNSGAAGSITVTASSISLTRVPEPSAIAGSILAVSLAWLAKRKQAAFSKAKA